jgi:hypothetical protein
MTSHDRDILNDLLRKYVLLITELSGGDIDRPSPANVG